MRFCLKPATNNEARTACQAGALFYFFFCRSNGVDASFLAGSGVVTIVISFCRHEVEVLIGYDFYLQQAVESLACRQADTLL